MTVFPAATLTAKARGRNAMIRRRFAIESPSHAPVAQWIEQPPPKGQVGRSIRLWGAMLLKSLRPQSEPGRRSSLHIHDSEVWSGFDYSHSGRELAGEGSSQRLPSAIPYVPDAAGRAPVGS